MSKTKRQKLSKSEIAYAARDAELVNELRKNVLEAEIKDDLDRSRYAMQVLMDLHQQGKGRTFGAHCAAFVADHPSEAKPLADKHTADFLKYKADHAMPSVNNVRLIHDSIQRALMMQHIKDMPRRGRA